MPSLISGRPRQPSIVEYGGAASTARVSLSPARTICRSQREWPSHGKWVCRLHLILESVGKTMIVFGHGRLVWSEEGTLLRAIFFKHNCDRLALDPAGVHSIDAR